LKEKKLFINLISMPDKDSLKRLFIDGEEYNFTFVKAGIAVFTEDENIPFDKITNCHFIFTNEFSSYELNDENKKKLLSDESPDDLYSEDKIKQWSDENSTGYMM
jgi:hypothetical protein